MDFIIHRLFILLNNDLSDTNNNIESLSLNFTNLKIKFTLLGSYSGSTIGVTATYIKRWLPNSSASDGECYRYIIKSGANEILYYTGTRNGDSTQKRWSTSMMKDGSPLFFNIWPYEIGSSSVYLIEGGNYRNASNENWYGYSLYVYRIDIGI